MEAIDKEFVKQHIKKPFNMSINIGSRNPQEGGSPRDAARSIAEMLAMRPDNDSATGRMQCAVMIMLKILHKVEDLKAPKDRQNIVAWAYVTLHIWKRHPSAVRQVMLAVIFQLIPLVVPDDAARVADFREMQEERIKEKLLSLELQVPFSDKQNFLKLESLDEGMSQSSEAARNGIPAPQWRHMQLVKHFGGIDGGGGGNGDTPQYNRTDGYAKVMLQFWGALCCGAGSQHLQNVMVPGMRGYGWSWLATMQNKVVEDTGKELNLVLFQGVMHQYLIIASYFLEGMYRGDGNENIAALFKSIGSCSRWKDSFMKNGQSRWGNPNAFPDVPLSEWCSATPTDRNPLGQPSTYAGHRKKYNIEESEFDEKMQSWIQYIRAADQ